MIGFFEVTIEKTRQSNPPASYPRAETRHLQTGERQRPVQTLTWLVMAMSAGEALNVAAAHANYPDPSDIAQVSVRECKRYDNILVSLPLTK